MIFNPFSPSGSSVTGLFMDHNKDIDVLVVEIKRRLFLLEPKMTFYYQRVELERLLSFIENYSF